MFQLALKQEQPEFQMEFQTCREITPEQVYPEDERYMFGKKDLTGYAYTYNGRTYRDITTLFTENLEELSKTAYIGRDIHGEKSLITYTVLPAPDCTERNGDPRALVYLIFDGKHVHMIVMEGIGRIAGLTFYEYLLSADRSFQPYFVKLGWPTDGIIWK